MTGVMGSGTGIQFRFFLFREPISLVGVVAAAIFAGTGCAASPVRLPPNQWSVTISTAQPCHALKNTRFIVTVVNERKDLQPVRDLNLDMEMPSMPMPPDSVVLHRADDGKYYGTGVFTMAGKWILSIRDIDSGVRQELGESPVVVSN